MSHDTLSGGGLRPGTVVGRYRLIDRIGAGGMAEVFLAQHDGPEGFARRVALKFVRPDIDDPDALRSLIDEARVAAQLSHPNIVQVTELGRHGDGFYLVMEFLQGWPLDRLIKLSRSNEVPPDLHAIVDLGLQLLDALKYAHEARGHDGTPLRVVHRDIKPGNIILDGLGLVKVVDFGIARSESIERRTATGIGKGTPAYMAPEQLRGEEVSAASDLFAVGVLMAELALGRRLFTADNFLALIRRRTEGFTGEDHDELRSAMPELLPVVERALRDDPAARFASATEMIDALRPVATVRARAPLRAWMERVLGDDPSEVLAASSSGARPIGAVDEATREVSPGWIEPLENDSVPPTRLVDPGSSAGTSDSTSADDDTKTAPPRRVRLPAIVGAIAIGALLGWGLWIAWPDDDPRDEIGEEIADADPATPDATPTPEASPRETPSPAATAPTVVAATPAPTPRRTPEATATTATPVPVESPAPPTPTPEPSEVTPAAGDVAPGWLTVGLLGSGGTVEVVGHEERPAPTGRMRIPAGLQTLRLKDLTGGLLASFRVEIRSGETSRCVWRRSDGGLVLVPDDEGAPCRMR